MKGDGTIIAAPDFKRKWTDRAFDSDIEPLFLEDRPERPTYTHTRGAVEASR